MRRKGLTVSIAVWALFVQVGSTLAQDQPLARLIKLVTAKEYKDVSLGVLCSQFSIQVQSCSGYQLNDDSTDEIPSFNTFKDARGVDRVVIGFHNAKSGFVYLTGPSGNLEAVAEGQKTDIFRWRRIAITTEARVAYKTQFDCWKKYEDLIATFPDRCSPEWNAQARPENKC